MSQPFDKIVTYWQSNYGQAIQKSDKLEVPNQFKRMADLMAPGKSYYYIANFHTLDLELVSDSVKTFIGEEPAAATMEKLLALALPEEIEAIHRKEKTIQHFMMEYLSPKERLDYKVSYTYKNKSYDGKERVMLHQATVLSINDMGQFIHVFSIHSDISHLCKDSAEGVSFINSKNGPSYYNVTNTNGSFKPEELNKTSSLKKVLTARELDIITELASGKNAKEIAAALHISDHTVRTHKKNILQKVDCKNSTHLVSICLAEGLITL
ncbi:response regulator transcription factor [Luteirhabdus pelagi]|uniref:response regulator transcription factor n=1 Tax=Luteirhabdus pelagi TaxID=2792783 RepID=UPI00193989FF|nr:LuxR C-terminal-related transcriptional regulator [Luteirhabdus pelagi]